MLISELLEELGVQQGAHGDTDAMLYHNGQMLKIDRVQAIPCTDGTRVAVIFGVRVKQPSEQPA